MKAEGLRAGIPDLFLAKQLADGSGEPDEWTIGGLFIEMKVKPNKPSPEQNRIIQYLDLQGYRVAVCYSADEAIKAIKDYLAAAEK